MKQQSICFEQTPAMKSFRRAAGDANRFLNTILVGLKTLQVNVALKPDDLAVGWSKPSSSDEWTATQNFALRGAMVALIDAIDQYLRSITQINGLAPHELCDCLNGRKHVGEKHRPTLPERIIRLCESYPNQFRSEYILAVTLLSAWRNKFVHFKHKEGISKDERKKLRDACKYFKNEFSGVNINEMIDRYEADGAPTLGDLSTLIAACQRLVRDIDGHLLHLQDPEIYAVELTRYLIKSSVDPSEELERIFRNGGTQSSGRLHALFLENGGNNSHNRTESAPSLSRVRLNSRLAIGQNKASELFGIKRPKT